MNEDDFINMVQQLQKKIKDDEEKTYSKLVINEYRNPTNFGIIENPDAVGIIKGPCGDTMNITLKIIDSIIQEARFWTDGCGATLAVGNMLAKKVKAKTVQEANNIDAKQLLDELQGLPKEHSHCALLAVNTLRKAIEHYKDKHKKIIHR